MQGRVPCAQRADLQPEIWTAHEGRPNPPRSLGSRGSDRSARGQIRGGGGRRGLPADGEVLVDLAPTWSRARAVGPWAVAAAVTLGCGRSRWRGGSSIGLSQSGLWLFRPADGARSGCEGRRGRSASAFRGVPDDSGSGWPCPRPSRPRGDPVVGVLIRTGSWRLRVARQRWSCSSWTPAGTRPVAVPVTVCRAPVSSSGS